MRGISRIAIAGALMLALTGVASANVTHGTQHSRIVHKGTMHASLHTRHHRHFARFRGYAPVYGYGYGYGAPVSSSVSSSYTGNTTATTGLSGSSGTGD